jgi:hypothetical protein
MKMKFAYADPPYFKQGKKRYGEFHEEAAIWDDKQSHLDLVQKLLDEYPDGWALSCNPADLNWIIKDRQDVRVCSWTKTFHQIRPTTIQFAWEPVILYGGRKDNKRKPMVRDWISGVASKRKGLPGAKPDYFNDWILSLLNYQEGDILDDLFPGTNGMAEAVIRFNERSRVIPVSEG